MVSSKIVRIALEEALNYYRYIVICAGVKHTIACSRNIGLVTDIRLGIRYRYVLGTP